MLKRGFQFAPGYRLQEFLGRGQFGQVWRATAPGGAAAAVKFIDLSDGQGEKEYEGVKRVKQIRHANLMPITAIWLLDGEGKVIEEAPDEANETIDLSVAEMKGQSALFQKPSVAPSWLAVSMLLGGKSLQQRLRECVKEGLTGIPPKELISYMDEAAKGIDFLNAPQHDLGEGPIAIQHSDVKPANIVLIGSSAVVCDFGLARILSRNQVTATSAAGTPAYMAPEAIAGKPSRTCDQYSLAVTYYHLRTGTLPVNDGSLWEVLDAHRLGKLKLGLVTEAEQEVLRKATDLNWENRFETNVDMVDALREALRVGGQTNTSFVPKSGEVAAPPAATIAAVQVATEATETAPLSGETRGYDSTTITPVSATSTLAVGITQTGAVLKTLLLSDLVDSTKLVESLGDEGAAALFRVHDRVARDLLAQFGGREIDKTDGFLMLFERPLNAALYALAYHEALAKMSTEQKSPLAARVGIHIGEVFLYENAPEDVARGAKAFEAEGMAKPMAARLMSLALGGQTLITRGFYDVAKRSAVGAKESEKKLEWLTHGSYRFKGVEDPIAVFEVGIEGLSPLKPPPDSEKVKRVKDGDQRAGEGKAKRSRPGSSVESANRNPMVMVGAGVGTVVALLVGAMALRPAPSPPLIAPNGNGKVHINGGSGNGHNGDPDKVVLGDPDELVREAIALLDTDEAGAIAKFNDALQISPGHDQLRPTKMAGHKGPIVKMVETPDGSFLVTAADDPTPFLWDLAGGTENPTRLEGHEGLVYDMAISPDGERLLTGGVDAIARVWNLKANDISLALLPLEGHEGAIEAVAWHPTEQIAVTASADGNIGVWEIGAATTEHPNGTITNSHRFPIEGTLTEKGLASDPNGKWLAATVKAEIYSMEFDAVVFPWEEVLKTKDSSPPPILVEAKNAKKIAFVSNEGESLLAVGNYGGGISLYSISDDREVKVANRNASAHSSDVEAIRVVHVDQRDVIATGSADGSVHWWKVGGTDENRSRSLGDAHHIACVDVSGDGRWLAAGAHDGSVWLWDTKAVDDESGAIQFVTGENSVDSVLIDVESRWLIAGCDDGVVLMWDLNHAKLLALTRPTRLEKIQPMKVIESKNSITMR